MPNALSDILKLFLTCKTRCYTKSSSIGYLFNFYLSSPKPNNIKNPTLITTNVGLQLKYLFVRATSKLYMHDMPIKNYR